MLNNKSLIKSIFALSFSFIFLNLSLLYVQAATFEFSPPTASIPSACSYEVDVKVDTEGGTSNAADIEITFDPTKVVVLDSNSSIPGIQVKNGSAYDSYVYNLVDNSTGIIRVAAGSLMSELNGRKTFITIKFQALPGATVANFYINFTGANNTLDSNVADSVTNLDLLTAVINGSYTFNSDSCDPDIIPPIIIVRDPTGPLFNGYLEIEADLTDEKSGVNVTTLQLVINGVVYDSSNAVITYSGDKFHYYIEIDPNLLINPGSPSMLLFTVRDYAGNMGSKMLYLNFPTPTPSPTSTPAPTQTATPTVTPILTEAPIPTITTLPETGPTPTPCPVYTDKTCQDIIDKEIEKGNYYDTNNVDEINITLGKFNLLLPGIGLLTLLSIILNLPVLYGIWLLILAIKNWKNKLINFIGIITDNKTGNPLKEANIEIFDDKELKLSETEPDCFGRYFFDIKAGQYIIDIKTPGYQEERRTINYLQDGKVIQHKLERIQKKKLFQRFFNTLKQFVLREIIILSILAVILSLLSLIYNQTTWSVIIFIINCIILIIAAYFRLSYLKKTEF